MVFIEGENELQDIVLGKSTIENLFTILTALDLALVKISSIKTGRFGGGREKTHGSSPSTSGKTNEKPSVIQTRRRQCTIVHHKTKKPIFGLLFLLMKSEEPKYHTAVIKIHSFILGTHHQTYLWTDLSSGPYICGESKGRWVPLPSQYIVQRSHKD